MMRRSRRRKKKVKADAAELNVQLTMVLVLVIDKTESKGGQHPEDLGHIPKTPVLQFG